MAYEADPTISRYIAMVQAFPQLSREEEMDLAKAWSERGDEEAADKLVRAHLRYVVAIALKYRRYGVPLSELIAEGNFGVVHALKKFQPDRGNRFVTYAAYWIRAYVLNYVIRSWSLVGAGSGALRSKMFFRLRRRLGSTNE
jgi:RNA polymerase sigma-32 factor